jgi:hypothetical protein
MNTRKAIRSAEAALEDIDAILARAIVRPKPTIWQRIMGWFK